MVYRCQCPKKAKDVTIDLTYQVDDFSKKFFISGHIPSKYRNAVRLAHHNCLGDSKLDGTGKLEVVFNIEKEWEFDDIEARADQYLKRFMRRTGLAATLTKI